MGALTGTVASLTMDLITDVTRIAERIERMQNERVRTISEATLARVTAAMADVVVNVLDRSCSSEVAAAIKRGIHDGWGTIRD